MAKKITFSPDQNNAANPLENVWVQANAGTGKTKVLVGRLLRILFRTPDITRNGILCLTYTNAGAGEMRNRILADLRTWALASDAELTELLEGVSENNPVTPTDIQRARTIFFTYIDNPDILKIKTIHGFCEEILRRFPLEAGISPSWSLVSDTAQRILLQDAFQNMINNPASDTKTYAAFEHIVGRISETYMDKLLDILSEQYKHFFQISDIVKYRKYFIDTTKNFLELSTGENLDFSAERLSEIIFLASNEQNSAKKPAKYLADIINLTKQYIENTIDFEEYKNAYLTQSGTKKSTVSKKDYLTTEQERVYRLNQRNANKMLFEDTVALFDLSAAFASEYQQIKRAHNLLDFEDLILYTRKLFSNSASMGWVLSQLDLSLSHILVDEAQDTSPQQWDILRMLSGDFFSGGNTTEIPNSLFVVGDTKQSIYGFQGADPAAFANSRSEIAEQIKQNLRTIREIPLSQSFRSTAPILHTVDKFFTDPGIVSVSRFANNDHKCFRKNDAGAVELHKLVAKQESGATLSDYITQIADKIQSLIVSGKYTASDIMVLVQQRNPMSSPLEMALKRRNIAVAGSDRIVLPQFPAIRDLLNLTRWCLNPADDFSLCCTLRSPVFRMNQVDIFNLCQQRNTINHSRKQEDKDATPVALFEVLETTYPDIHTTLLQIKDLSAYAAPHTFYSYILNHYGARKNFVSALGEQVIAPLEEFITICLAYERTQPGTLHHFLKWFITGNSEIKRDLNASNGVRIVTVHGSKGLEAPVIFLIDTVRTPKTDTVLPIASAHDMPVWLWAARGDFSAQRAIASEQSASVHTAEYYRLLYVAMTRARDELYIYGFTPHKHANENAWHPQLWRVLANNTSSEYIRITNDDIA